MILEMCKGVHCVGSRREISNACFLAKFGFDTAENEPAKKRQNFVKNRFSDFIEASRGKKCIFEKCVFGNAFFENAFFENAFFENEFFENAFWLELSVYHECRQLAT